MTELFDPKGGYRKLFSFTYATMIQLGTIQFCDSFIPFRADPLGKNVGQMTGAARSGRQNIIEGSERAATSKETEMRLIDVARASLGELLGDYEVYLARKNILPWSRHDQEYREMTDLRLREFEYTDDTMHDYWQYFHEAKKPFARWLESDDDTVVARAMIVLIARTMGMLQAQIDRLGQNFLAAGGFKERLFQCRSEARDRQSHASEPDAPVCPDCGRTMLRRVSRSGRNAGAPFWGCADYPKCHGTREVEPPEQSNAPNS